MHYFDDLMTSSIICHKIQLTHTSGRSGRSKAAKPVLFCDASAPKLHFPLCSTFDSLAQNIEQRRMNWCEWEEGMWGCNLHCFHPITRYRTMPQTTMQAHSHLLLAKTDQYKSFEIDTNTHTTIGSISKRGIYIFMEILRRIYALQLFCPKGQIARFGAGCHIEMATLSHQLSK